MRSMLLLKDVYVLANFLTLWGTFRFMAIFFRFMATLGKFGFCQWIN